MVSYTHPNIKAQKQTKCIFPLLDPEPRSAAVFALGSRQAGKDQDFDDLFPFCKGRPCHSSHAKVDHVIVAMQRRPCHTSHSKVDHVILAMQRRPCHTSQSKVDHVILVIQR